MGAAENTSAASVRQTEFFTDDLPPPRMGGKVLSAGAARNASNKSRLCKLFRTDGHRPGVGLALADLLRRLRVGGRHLRFYGLRLRVSGLHLGVNSLHLGVTSL